MSVKPSCKVLLAKFAMSCWALLRSIKDVSAFFKLTSWPQNVKTWEKHCNHSQLHFILVSIRTGKQSINCQQARRILEAILARHSIHVHSVLNPRVDFVPELFQPFLHPGHARSCSSYLETAVCLSSLYYLPPSSELTVASLQCWNKKINNSFRLVCCCFSSFQVAETCRCYLQPSLPSWPV